MSVETTQKMGTVSFTGAPSEVGVSSEMCETMENLPKTKIAEDASTVQNDAQLDEASAFADRGESAVVFDIQRYAVHDGPGIRTIVFFKGCPLKCDWCSNPESQNVEPELLQHPRRCIGCNECIQVCPTGAARGAATERGGGQSPECQGCFKCAAVCPSHSRAVAGAWMTVEQVMDEVVRDSAFYARSGGGLTVGGGEPLMWSRFVERLFFACKGAAISTVMETCGYGSRAAIERVSRHLDLALLDIKHMDDESHIRHTGASNRVILRNAALLAEAGVRIRVRVPIIPGFNDNPRAVGAIAQFVGEKRIADTVDLLPYHQFAEDKYLGLGREYQCAGYPIPTVEQMLDLALVVRSRGLSAMIGGRHMK